MKHVLVTGAESYVGENVKCWLMRFPEDYQVDTLDMKKETWRTWDFSKYQVVFHVAGIVHMSTRKAAKWQEYYKINTRLAVEVAQKAKDEGVGQFIFMSSMSVYGNTSRITSETRPEPENYYGASKWKAEQKLKKLSTESFRIVVLRPPMVYGKGAKGNYPILSKIARKTVIFPKVNNRRSMIYIENLCEFIKMMIDGEEEGTFFPQDKELVNTSDMVQKIAKVQEHPIWITGILAPGVWMGCQMPGRIGKMCQKAFGSCYYDMAMSEYGKDYRVCGLEEAIERTER